MSGGTSRALQPLRDVADGAQVRGHVLADPAIAARRARHEGAVAVGERHGGAVDLEFRGESRASPVRPPPRSVAALAYQSTSARPRERIVERVIGTRCACLARWSFGNLGARPPPWASRASRSRVLRLERDEFAVQPVVLGVAQRRPVEDVVLVRCPGAGARAIPPRAPPRPSRARSVGGALRRRSLPTVRPAAGSCPRRTSRTRRRASPCAAACPSMTSPRAARSRTTPACSCSSDHAP